MKEAIRKLTGILILILLLTACAPMVPAETTTVPVTDATVAPTAVPTTIPATVPPTEAATEPVQPAWLREPVYPSYQELFSQDRKYESCAELYHEKLDPCSWFVMDGNTGVKYTLELNNFTGPYSNELYIYCEADGTGKTVWHDQDQRIKTLLGCDGRYAYVMDAEYSAEAPCRILRVDMLEGTEEAVAEAEFFLDVCLSCDAVLYYAAYEETEQKISIHRVYLPEKKNELLVEPDVPAEQFKLLTPESTLGDIRWHSLSQEIQLALKKELSDPDSVFKDVKSEILWEEEGPVWDPVRAEALDYLCRILYGEKNVEVYDRYHYNLETDTVTVRTLDRVPMLAGYEPSACVLSPWEELPDADIQETLIGRIPSRTPTPLLEGEGFYPGKLYFVQEGCVTAVVDEDFLQVQALEDAVYCVTADKKILQIDYEGSVCNTLYASEGDILEVWGYYDKCLYIREDNRMLELDLVELKYRTLISFDEGKIVYGVNRMNGDGFGVDVHHKDAVYVHRFMIKEEAFLDTREWSNYGDTVSEVE